jgi:hypothetical protein
VLMGVEVGSPTTPGRFTVDLSFLPDDTHTFSATAEDLAGNVSAASPTLTFTVDTTAPFASEFRLAPESDTGVLGDATTALGVIDLVGRTDASATVKLLATGQTVTAAADGSFRFTGIPLGYGATVFAVELSDAVGNKRTV